MNYPSTPYERVCCLASTVEVLADSLDDDGSNTSNVLRLVVRELDAIKAELGALGDAEEAAGRQAAE